ARCGLDDDTMKVKIVGITDLPNDDGYEADILVDATVHNGAEKCYEVCLASHVATCSCKDYEHRGQLCKHICSVAYYLMGDTNPTEKTRFQCGQAVQLRGLRRHGKVVCVSGETISVRWEPVMTELKPGFTQAYNIVELENAA